MGIKTKLVSILLSSLFCTFCFAANPAKQIIPIQSWTTANGAKVYFVPIQQLPMLNVNIVFKAGSAYDGATPGIANLTASMLDEGTDSLNADQIAENFDNIGADYNSHVSRDMTVLSLRTLTRPELLNKAINLTSALLSKPNFPETNFQRVQTSILNGLKQQQQNPATVANLQIYAKLYGQNPYAHNVLGSAASITQLTNNDLKQFYQTYYVAKNALITLVGNINAQQAHDIANQLSQGLQAGGTATMLPLENVQQQKQEFVVPYPVSQTAIRIGQIGIKRGDPDYFALQVGNYTFGGGPLVSRLFDNIRNKRGLSYSPYSYFSPLTQPGPFIITLQTRNNKVKEALQVTNTTLSTFIANGPTNKEVKAAKQHIIGAFPLKLASNKNISKVLVTLGFYGLPLNYLDTYMSKIQAVSKDQIQQAFKRHVNPEQMTTIIVGTK